MTAVKRRFALAALLAVLVVATAAAGLDGAGSGDVGESSASPESGFGIGSNTGIGSGNESGVGLSSADGSGGSPVPPFLIEHAVSFVMLLAITMPIVYALVVLWQDGLRGLLDLLGFVTKRFVMIAAVLVSLLALLYLFAMLLGDGGGGALGTSSTSGSVLGGSDGGAPISLTSLPVPLLIAGALVAVVALTVLSDRTGATSTVAAALAGGAGSARRLPHDESDDATPSSTTLDDVEPTNEVYRAWLELALSLDATARADTPHEVADRAIERGLDADAVAQLTAVFREVRYSGAPVTAEHERRARDAERRLWAGEATGSIDPEV